MAALCFFTFSNELLKGPYTHLSVSDINKDTETILIDTEERHVLISRIRDITLLNLNHASVPILTSVVFRTFLWISRVRSGISRARLFLTPECSHNKADIVFLLDASYSEGVTNFKQQLSFIINFTKAYEIGRFS